MEDGPPRFPQGFSCPVVLGYPIGARSVSSTGLSPSLAGRSRPFDYRTGLSLHVTGPHNPGPAEAGPVWALPRSLAATDGISRLISLPRGTEMVHFPRLASSSLCIQPVIIRHDPDGVAPFGHLRIEGCLPLPEAYRSLLRPSSPLCAKASTVNP